MLGARVLPLKKEDTNMAGEKARKTIFHLNSSVSMNSCFKKIYFLFCLHSVYPDIILLEGPNSI